MSKRHPGKNSKRTSRAEGALGELCTKLGYCLPPDDQEAILSNPPTDADAFVNAVLIAEGRDPNLMTKQELRLMLDIVDKWAVYDSRSEDGSISNRSRFPNS
jgi:hypothetical protein